MKRTGSCAGVGSDLKRVIAERFGVDFHPRYVGKLLKKLGFSHVSARPRHPAQDERTVEAFKNFPRALKAHVDGLPETTPVEIWFEDEAASARRTARFGNGPGAERGQGTADQRYDNAYLFGAICPARGVGAALALPYADAAMMQLHLDEISRNVAEGAHAVLLLDRADGTRRASSTCRQYHADLPAFPRPGLNPVENVWQYLRQNWLSNTVFENYDAIVDAAARPGKSSSLNPKQSPPSECATELTSVSRYDPWYNGITAVGARRRGDITEGRAVDDDAPGQAPRINLQRVNEGWFRSLWRMPGRSECDARHSRNPQHAHKKCWVTLCRYCPRDGRGDYNERYWICFLRAPVSGEFQ